MNIPWTPTEDAILKQQFANGKDITRDVMPLLPGRTYNAIRSRATKYLGVKMKKLPIHDRTFFDVPNEINCSIAGFLAADGCISNIGRLTLGLSTKDRSHLETIVKAVQYSGRIYDYVRPYNLIVKKYGKETPYDGTLYVSTIQIQCPELCAALARNWNITPRKTHTLLPPPLTNPRLVMAYLSGLIDGDGWIIEDKSDPTRGCRYTICVMGTKEMMEWTKAMFDLYVPHSDGAALQPNESSNIYDYGIGGAKVYWLAKLFWALDIPRLTRKWDKLKDLIGKVEGGMCSPRFRRAVARCHPSDEILAAFGLHVSVTQPLEPQEVEVDALA